MKYLIPCLVAIIIIYIIISLYSGIKLGGSQFKKTDDPLMYWINIVMYAAIAAILVYLYLK